MIRLTLLIAAAFALLAGRAEACSVVPTYVTPDGFELTQQADAIVIATAVSGGPADAPPAQMPEGVRFRIDRAIKGEAAGEVLLPMGVLGTPEPSDPRQLVEPHPESGAGACNRYTFAKGRAYVLFLRRDTDGKLYPLGMPFARVSEDYSGPDSLWVRAIWVYLSLQRAHSGEALYAAVEAEAARLEAGSADDKAIAATLRAYLLDVSPYKPSFVIIEAWRALGQGHMPARSIISLRAGWDDAPWWMGDDYKPRPELMPGAPIPPGADVRPARRALLDYLLRDPRPDAADFFAALAADPASGPVELAAAAHYFVLNGQTAKGLALANGRMLADMAATDQAEADWILRRFYDAFPRPYPGQPQPSWLTDPAAAGWPELALRLSPFDTHDQPRFAYAIARIPVTDYRARPAVTRARATTEEEGGPTLAWAIQALNGPAPDYGEAEPDRLPLEVLVLSPTDKALPALDRAFCQGGGRRGLLIEVIGDAEDAGASQLLIRYGQAKGLDDRDRERLAKAAAGLWSRREDITAQEVLTALLTKGKFPEPWDKHPPLRCPAA